MLILAIIPELEPPNFNISYRLGGNSYLRFQEIKDFNDVDILFVGSSHAYRGFDVRVFEKYSFYTFNLGTSQQTAIQAQLLLSRYLDLLNPKLVVYAVAPGVFTTTGAESALDIISNDKNDVLSAKMVFKINNLQIYNTFIYASIRQLFKLDSDFIYPMRIENLDEIDTYISGGYVEVNTNIYYNSAEADNQEFEISLLPYQLNSFKEIISDFNKRNINYILVRPPVANYNNCKNNEYFDSIMHQYGQYYDFNKVLSFNDYCYYDTLHLRQEYAEIFSSSVADLIISLNILENLN
jgi:hypothetical protein